MYPQGYTASVSQLSLAYGCAIFPVLDTEEWAEKIRSRSQAIDSEVPKGNSIW